MKKFFFYFALSRPDNWIKNLLIIPGFLFAYAVTPSNNTNLILKLILAAVSVCLISSANYIINEWLDRNSDRFHPVKKNRHAVINSLQAKYVFLEYAVFACLGLLFAIFLSVSTFILSLIFLLLGIIYNLKPIRTKDIIFLDVVTEAINNPIRLLLGWFVVTTAVLPSFYLMFSFWMGGAYVMGIKRYAELQSFNDPVAAACYRNSFKYYTSQNLIASALFYSFCAGICWTAFIKKIYLLGCE